MSSTMTTAPLLRNLKRDLVAVKEEAREKNGIKVSDASNTLSTFCRSLELSFKHGMKDSSLEYFEVFRALAKESNRRADSNGDVPGGGGLHALVRHVVTEIETLRNLRNGLGRGRYFLRCCLKNGWVTSLVMSLRKWKDVEKLYHNDALILRNPNDSVMEILPSLERLHFDLHLPNLSFLSDSWDLPDRITFELVPSSDLGLMICSVEGRVIVSKVKHYSVAGEDGKCERGDVVDELDSTPTYGLPPESVADVVKRCQRRPLKVSVVKAIAAKSGEVFAPLRPLHEEAGISSDDIEKEWKKRKSRWRTSKNLEDGEGEFDPLLDDEEDLADEVRNGGGNVADTQGGFKLLYVGSLKIGQVGDSSVLDRAIDRVTSDPKKVHHPVTLRLLELGIKMLCNDTGDAVLHYTYPEISACGCSSRDHHYLGFIAGNDLCSLATEYLCHVFYSANVGNARDIIATIADGFDRTKNAV